MLLPDPEMSCNHRFKKICKEGPVKGRCYIDGYACAYDESKVSINKKFHDAMVKVMEEDHELLERLAE
jgi:hypothetical protein